jgi:hypothetical protein
MPESAIPAYDHQPNPPFKDLRDGTHGGSASRKDKEAPFRKGTTTAGFHRPPGSHRDEHELTARRRAAHRDGTTTHNGLNASWALSWPEQRAAGVQPIVLHAYFRGGFHHPHLRGTTVQDWPLNVFSDKDAAAQLSILRAIASSDLHNLVYRADYRIVTSGDSKPRHPARRWSQSKVTGCADSLLRPTTSPLRSGGGPYIVAIFSPSSVRSTAVPPTY